MRQVIRALGWAINIFWITLLFFAATAVYSAFQISPEFGQVYTSTQGEILTFSLPLNISNGGLYDIFRMNLTTMVKDTFGSFVSESSTFVRLVSRGDNVQLTHSCPINLRRLTSANLAYLLFNDSVFDIDASLKLNYANAVPLQISTNFTLPWSAPFSNLTIGSVSASPYNATHFRASIPISFENHSIFSLNGTIKLEFVDDTNLVLGSGISNIDLIPQSDYSFSLEAFVLNPASIKQANLYFATSFLSYGPVVIPFV